MVEQSIMMDSIQRQRAYVQEQKSKGGGLGIVFADAFVRGMREIGYKNPAWAMAELIDNAIQAAASVIEVRFGFAPENSSQAKPDMLAIVDNGNGMLPEMISYAVRWGGTDRENERKGFGRFGYGLPSSAVSIARRYSVYSKIAEGEWHRVTVDLEELAAIGGDLAATERMLTPVAASLPLWIGASQGPVNVATIESGTVVVLEDIDRLRRANGWILTRNLESKLMQHFGVIYRHWLHERRILVNGKAIEPVDPLFQMPNARFVQVAPVKAVAQVPHAFTIESADGRKGTIRIRASVLPPDFQLEDPKTYGKKGAALNKPRHEIMKDYNGILICREGRQIDTVKPEWTAFQVYDRNIKIEVDFDPNLDEYFGITTAKQQIVLDDFILEKLKQKGRECGGLQDLIEDMRREFKRMKQDLDAASENEGDPEERGQEEIRLSEEVMDKIAKFKTRRSEPTREQVREAQENLEKEAESISKSTGESKEEVKERLTEKTKTPRWHLEFKSIEEGPFYIPRRMGQQRWLIINTAHPFYEKVYCRSPALRQSLEIMLLVIADFELDAKDDRAEFYRTERGNWSQMLRHALDELLSDVELMNSSAWEAEIGGSTPL